MFPSPGYLSNTILSSKKFAQSLQWPFSKDEVKHLVTIVERQKSLLSIALTNDSLRLSTAIKGDVDKLTQDVAAVRTEQESHVRETRRIGRLTDSRQRKAILTRLSPIDFEAIHTDISSRPTAGTGTWLFKTEQIESWLCESGFSWLVFHA